MKTDHSPAHAPRSGSGLFERFLDSEVAGSVVLLACTIAALVWANSSWADFYERILHAEIGFTWGNDSFALSIHHWINDGLMVIFFFVVGLEIKRELLVGELSSVKKAVLPVMAALGGMVCPAAIYALLNMTGAGASGWGIPMATDIAFSLGVLSLLGQRVPTSLKVLLTAAAIADDLGAVAVIGLFYTESIWIGGLVLAAILMMVLYVVARILRVRRLIVLLSLIIGIWACVFASGVHATVAGILVALLVPVRPMGEPRHMLDFIEARIRWLLKTRLSARSIVLDHDQLAAVVDIEDAARSMQPAGLRLEHYWHPVQAYFILPLFALANAGVRIDQGFAQSLTSPVGLGVLLGLFVGKPLGFILFSWLTIRAGQAELPEGVSWKQLAGVSCLAGIGFTMSLFVTELAFTAEDLIAHAKLGILIGSLVSAVAAYLVLVKVLPPGPPPPESHESA